MASRLPTDVDDATKALHAVVERLGFAPTTPENPRLRAWRGTLSGLPVLASVYVYSKLGVPLYTLESTVSFDTPLALGLELGPGDPERAWRAILHIPPTWRSHPALHRITTGRSKDPLLSRAVLGESPPPAGSSLVVAGIDDEGITFLQGELPTASEVKRHLVEGAEWAARVAAAARDRRPREHDEMPEALWREVVRRHRGELDRRTWQYRREGPAGTLHLGLRWDPGQGYSLQGQLRWPALPLDRLKLTLQAPRSWLQRLFLRDVEVGDVPFDEAFLVDVEEGPTPLEELLTPTVRQGLVALAAHTSGLSVDRAGADFRVRPPPADPADLDRVVDPALAILEELHAARSPSRGAYR